MNWGKATPSWVRAEVGDDVRLRQAIDECLGEAGHPVDMDLFPRATGILSELTALEIDELVSQGCL